MEENNVNEKLLSQKEKQLHEEHSKEIRESMSRQTLNDNVDQNYWLYFYLFCIVGLVNNNGYVMVGTAAHDLAELFDKKKLMPMFQLSEIIFGSLVKFCNSRYFIKVKHIYRLTFNSVVMLMAYLLIAAITIKTFEAGFWISLFCAIMHGFTSSLGESTLLGMLKGFPSKLVGAFGSGTGCAGVFGAGIFLVLKPFMNDGFIFLIATPLVLLYFINCLILSRRKSFYPFVEENPDAQERAATIRSSLNKNDSADVEEKTDEDGQELEGIDVGDDANDNIPFTIANAIMIFKKAGWFLVNLSSVYFLEYACTTSFADIYSTKIQNRAENDPDINEKSIFIKDSYIIFAFCYQFGVLISRSSLAIIKIKRVGIITSLQLINFIFWFMNAQFFFLKIQYVMFVWMVFVGLMGGASYVNVMYQIINSQKLKKKEKELAVMICCIFNDFGILLASLFALTLANTLFSDV